VDAVQAVESVLDLPALLTPETLVPAGSGAAELIGNFDNVITTLPVLGPAEPSGKVPSIEAFPEAVLGIDLTDIHAIGASALVAAGLVSIARGALSPNSLTFTNIRLLPCFVNASIQHSGATAISSGPPISSGPAISSVPRVGRRAADLIPSRVIPAAGSALGHIREGFDDVLREGLPDRANVSRGLSPAEYDSGRDRLLMQVGVALGTVYLVFLTLWFWATRLRWNGGWRARV
jgi:hypothetical protein